MGRLRTYNSGIVTTTGQTMLLTQKVFPDVPFPKKSTVTVHYYPETTNRSSQSSITWGYYKSSQAADNNSITELLNNPEENVDYSATANDVVYGVCTRYLGYLASSLTIKAEYSITGQFYDIKTIAIGAPANSIWRSDSDVYVDSEYPKGATVTVTPTPSSNYRFIKWERANIVNVTSTLAWTTWAFNGQYVQDGSYGTGELNLRFRDLTGTFYDSFTAELVSNGVDIYYDDTLVYAASTGWLSSDYQIITIISGSDATNSSAIYWFIDNGTPIGDRSRITSLPSDKSVEFTCSKDEAYIAHFYEVYDITGHTQGNGEFGWTRSSFYEGICDENDVTFTAVPSQNHHFVKYVINGVEYTDSTLSLHLTQDTDVTAYFEENDKLIITAAANVNTASIYISEDRVHPNTEITVFARPLSDYQFVKWEDGTNDNPRTITVTNSMNLFATYHRMAEEPSIYPYRCYIKDQLHLTDPPIAFLRVKSFDIKTDLLTNSNSTIKTIDDSSAIDNGDILVLYDPKGRTLYQGVIKSMKSKDTNTFGDMNNDQNHEMEITCSQMQSFYKGNWIYNVHPSNTLEQEIAYLLGQYAQGKLYKCSWTDALVAQRLGGITVQYTGSTSAKLPTDKDENDEEQLSTMDMEDFIYALYEEYGIIFDFEINFSGANYVHIKVPTYTTLKVGNNMFAIKNMSPITEVEEVNKLVIFASDKTYRTTYIATTTGIVQTPATTANRFNITNTEIVFSDDDAADLVSAYLPATMYNHKLTFDLLIKNFIYEFGDFNLGGSLDVWHGEDYYNTVLTGYEIKKNENQNITEVHFICGKVRTALTKKLTMGTV